MAIDDDLCGMGFMSYLVRRAGLHILTRICSIFIHNLHVFDFPPIVKPRNCILSEMQVCAIYMFRKV